MTHPTARSHDAAPSPAPAVTASRAHSRRSILLGAAAGALAGLVPDGLGSEAAHAAVLPGALPAAGAPFSAATVLDLARALAAQPYAAGRTDDLPDALRSLSREQYGAIRTRAEARIWAEAGLGLTVEPLHRGSAYIDRVALFLVEDGAVRPVAYAREAFEPGGPALPEMKEDPGFSGFRVRARFDGGERGELGEFAVFQGASFFRLVARGQGFGATARALILRPADGRGEEFPRWRAFFLERPSADGPLVVHALIDSESLAGAFRFTLRPGDASVADVEGMLVTRAAIDHVGLAGMQTSYLFGPNDRRGSDDARAAAYASGGLQVRNGGDEAIWRPVHNPDTLQISSFLDDGPRGFGLMQRARDYADFADDVQHWERRPSLWMEPGSATGVEGLWGAGAVTLLEIPSDSEANENILGYWRPRVVLPARAEVGFRYRALWCWQLPAPPSAAAAAAAPAAPPALAAVTGSRSGRGASGTRRLFLVDFLGDGLFDGAGAVLPDLAATVTAGPGAIARQTLYPYPDRRTVRVAFELDPGGEHACELRLVLKSGERPASETWLYRWTP